jgi:intein/homing endonuclease
MHVLSRLGQVVLAELEPEELARAVSKRRPPQVGNAAVAPLFAGTLRFVKATFSSSGTDYAIPAADLGTAIGYARLSAPPISSYASQYGPNSLTVAIDTISLRAWVTSGRYNDQSLAGWVDQLAKGQGLGSDSCLVFLNPQGVVNVDADVNQGVLGYHNISPGGIPYAFVNVMGQGLTVDDQKDVYAVALSHEIAEMTVDPLANGSNPEVCDSCLPPDQILLGDNKPISNYAVGNVVTGLSGLQGITDKFLRNYNGDLVEIKALGMLPFRVTPNHPLLVVTGQSSGLNIHYASPQWKDAGQVIPKVRGYDGDYLVMPRLAGTLDCETIDLGPYIERRVRYLEEWSSRGSRHIHWRHSETARRKRHRPCPTCGSPMSEAAKHCWDCFLREKPTHAGVHLSPKAFPLNKETAWLLGLYVAEGFRNPAHYSVGLSLAEKEGRLAERAARAFQSMGLHPYAERVPNERAITVICGSLVFVDFLSEVCGRGAANKKIPDFILYHKNEGILQAFLDGYIQGDGSSKNTQKGYRVSSFSTTSKILALQLQLAFGRLGVFISLRIERPDREGVILGRRVTMKETYTGVWCSDARATRRKRFHKEAFYLPVKRVKAVPYSGFVHNLETEDHTYLVSNMVVHNCAGNCNVDHRNYFDSRGNWLGGTATPGYSFFIDGIATPATVAQCPAPQSACSYPPPASVGPP